MLSLIMNLFGLNKFLSILIMVGSIVVVVSSFVTGIYFYGKQVGKSECRDAVLQRTIEEKDRQLKEANKILKEDSKKAIENENELEKLKGIVNDTPKNDNNCLDINAVNRLRSIQ